MATDQAPETAPPETESDPYGIIRQQIETDALDEAVADERDERLIAHRDALEELLDLAESYLPEKEPEKGPPPAVAKLRENADIREALISRHLATEEACDQMGLYSHSELDRLAEAGLLETTAAQVEQRLQSLGH